MMLSDSFSEYYENEYSVMTGPSSTATTTSDQYYYLNAMMTLEDGDYTMDELPLSGGLESPTLPPPSPHDLSGSEASYEESYEEIVDHITADLTAERVQEFLAFAASVSSSGTDVQLLHREVCGPHSTIPSFADHRSSIDNIVPPASGELPPTPPVTPPLGRQQVHPDHSLPSIEMLLPPRPTKRKRAGDHLYKFLLEILETNSHPHCIRWLNRRLGTFIFLDGEQVASLWGERKKEKSKTKGKKMDYGKMTRAIRHYYKDGTMQHYKLQRKVYQFGPEVLSYLVSRH